MNASGPTSEHGEHERKDADVVALSMVGGLLILGGVLVILCCWGFIHILTLRGNARDKAAATMAGQMTKFPGPHLIVQPGSDFPTLQSAQEHELNSYGWVDRKAGKVRIPIDRAMQLLIERGLPDVGANKTPLQLMQERPQQGETPTPTPGAAP
jgi:hypothetical protein